MIHLGEIAADRTDMLARFHAVFGQDNWVHRTNGWTLVGVNPASFDTKPGSAQVAWLRDTLDGCTGPIGLFLHEPWFKSLGSGVSRETRGSLEALFDGHDLRFVALGHTHQVHEHHADGVGSDWLPSIAFVESDAEDEGDGPRLVGLARLTLDRTGHHFELVEVSGIQGFDPADYVVEFPEMPVARVRAYA
jgi:hypothetical protein